MYSSIYLLGGNHLDDSRLIMSEEVSINLARPAWLTLFNGCGLKEKLVALGTTVPLEDFSECSKLGCFVLSYFVSGHHQIPQSTPRTSRRWHTSAPRMATPSWSSMTSVQHRNVYFWFLHKRSMVCSFFLFGCLSCLLSLEKHQNVEKTTRGDHRRKVPPGFAGRFTGHSSPLDTSSEPQDVKLAFALMLSRVFCFLLCNWYIYIYIYKVYWWTVGVWLRGVGRLLYRIRRKSWIDKKTTLRSKTIRHQPCWHRWDLAIGGSAETLNFFWQKSQMGLAQR